MDSAKVMLGLMLCLFASAASAEETYTFVRRAINASDIRVVKECTLAGAIAVQVLVDNPNSEQRRAAAVADLISFGEVPGDSLIPTSAALSGIETLLSFHKLPFNPAIDTATYQNFATAVCSRLLDAKPQSATEDRPPWESPEVWETPAESAPQ